MAELEETQHKIQYEGAMCASLYLVANLMALLDANEPYTGATEALAQQAATAAWANAQVVERTRSKNLAENPPLQCDMEREAKNIAGSSYRVSLLCGYPMCPPR